MRFLRFELKNYAGIVNGMGLETLTIDFSKCKNVITLICGKNGVGKSTLLKAMNPLPDTTDCYLDGAHAHKAMTIQDDGSIFEILIVSDLNGNLVRLPNKAYVKKNGVELNPTGNIGSYKDIIFNEFELDANYITLARLSNEDRGLAMKTPSERKKFIASILSTIEVYNAINKALIKRVNVFKSYINNLDGKIKNIGDPLQLQTTVEDTEMRLKRLQGQKEALKISLGEMNGFIKAADPDGRIQEQYQLIYNQLQEVNKVIEGADNTCDIDSIDDLDTWLYKQEATLDELEKEQQISQIKYDTLLQQETDLRRKLEVDIQKLENQKNGFEIENLETTVTSYRDQVKSLESKFNAAQIPYETISRDEFTTILSVLETIREGISAIHFNFDNSIINIALKNNKDDIYKKIEELQNENEKLTEVIINSNSQIESYEKSLESISILSNRPDKCKIDTCPFISDMVSTSKNKDKIKSDINKLQKDINKSIKLRVSNTNKMTEYREAIDVYNYINNILVIISSNAKLIKKFPTISFFLDTDEILQRIENSNTFVEIEDLLKYVDVFNEVETLKGMKTQLVTLEADYKIALAKQETINLLEEAINEERQKVQEVEEESKGLGTILQLLGESITRTQQEIERKRALRSAYSQRQELKEKYKKIKEDIGKIKEYIDNINLINTQLQAIEHELPSVEKERDDLTYALTNLRQYQAELEQYQQKYNYTNTLKKYSSPTTGIQTIYMDMYMGKTLKMANDLLGMMFDGEYSLLPYVVNEQEFRIPFIGNGLPVDDISSGSTSQLCIIGTIMNLVLLYQASTKYNIVSLDEVDGGLDSHNRYNFIPTLYRLIEILNINQLVMISHNIESDLSNVDVIRLKGYDDDSINYDTANIIYDYNV